MAKCEHCGVDPEDHEAAIVDLEEQVSVLEDEAVGMEAERNKAADALSNIEDEARRWNK